jgi:hypothetical protein
VPVLTVAVAVLGTWFVVGKWRSSKGPEAAKRVGKILGIVWKVALAGLGLVVLAALAQGCDGTEPSSGSNDPTPAEDQPPCTAFHAEDCAPGGDAPDPASQNGTADLPREPCPAFRAEDCPLAPATTGAAS